ncbi:MAG TPA: GatB/YqeY domain-containing protein [Gemmatimonadales bacterium]|nr:GatB/YqeY domain-containing protein [Gemmatimonadales bacterium]
MAATLKDRIHADLADAMRARDEARKSALRLLMAAIRNAEIPAAPEDEADLERIAAEGKGAGLDDEAVIEVIQKQVKQRRDSIDQYLKADRQDLVDKEQAELDVLETYLPQQASREEIEAAARKAVAETGAAGPRDMGKVMPVVMAQFKGRADGRVVSEVVRSLLGA